MMYMKYIPEKEELRAKEKGLPAESFGFAGRFFVSDAVLYTYIGI